MMRIRRRSGTPQRGKLVDAGEQHLLSRRGVAATSMTDDGEIEQTA
jgi:hypothetical protein